MAERKTQSRAVKNPVKRKLTRAEKKEIAAVIQASKGDGKPHTDVYKRQGSYLPDL